MELTDDLVAIQGIVISVIKITGELTKINYRGGSEEKIVKVIEEIQKHLQSKNYIKDGKISPVFDKQIEDIVLFLAINTKYKTPLELQGYDHLINIMPQLSKCVFANVVYGLDLCKYYRKVIEKLPISYAVELLEEMVLCVKKAHPEIQLRYIIIFLRGAATKLSSTEISEKDEDDIYKVTEVTNMMLHFLTGIYPGHTKNLRAMQVHQHMGYTMLSLFELLLYCNKENRNLKKFIENVLNTCCIIMRNVTINVFCSWAEIKEGDEPLQTVLAGKAYEIVEEYKKHAEAKELVGMLSTIAKKPKTLSERIQAADTATIIKKVFIKDQDQKEWFRALLGTQVFDNEDAMRCVGTWGHLCDANDVARLLNLSRHSNSDKAKQLAVKCASNLILEDLLLVMTRYFYENKFADLPSDITNAELQLKQIFNKTTLQTDIDDDFIKDLCLLMLQSPKMVTEGVYEECLGDKCYTACYERFLSSLKEVLSINGYGVAALVQTCAKNQPEVDNVDNYVALLKTLLEIGILSNCDAINRVLLPLLEQFRWDKDFQRAGCVLQIFLGCSLKIPASSNMCHIKYSLWKTMGECRCTFLEMNMVKQQTANYAVEVIKNLCEVTPDYDFEAQLPPDRSDEFADYYKKYLSSKLNSTLLRFLCSDFNTDNNTECIAQLLQFLPRAVTREWSSIVEELFCLCGSPQASELLTDVMILLCKVAVSQDPESNTGMQVIIALKYCLQQYGAALQNIQLDSNLVVEVDITKNVCRLLRHLPEPVRDIEGLSIVNILTERSLKSLVGDREFVCLLISINNSLICRTIKQRMVDE